MGPFPADGKTVVTPAFISALDHVNTSLPSVLLTLSDLAICLAYVKGESRKTFTKLENRPELLLYTAVGSYFVFAAYYSLITGSSVVTWVPHLQQCFELFSRQIMHGMDSINELLVNHESVTRQLGKLVLEEQVPNVADLPFEAILEIRRRRSPELAAFREGLRELSAEVDPSLDSKQLESALRRGSTKDLGQR